LTTGKAIPADIIESAMPMYTEYPEREKKRGVNRSERAGISAYQQTFVSLKSAFRSSSIPAINMR
jgi:hypothetical protein